MHVVVITRIRVVLRCTVMVAVRTRCIADGDGGDGRAYLEHGVRERRIVY